MYVFFLKIVSCLLDHVISFLLFEMMSVSVHVVFIYLKLYVFVSLWSMC